MVKRKGKGFVLVSVLIVIVLLGIMYFTGLFGQSSIVVSPPATVQLEDGRVHWVMTNVGTDWSGSSYKFSFLKGQNLLSALGYEPKKSQVITAKGFENSCEYQLSKVTYKVFYVFPYDYYVLGNFNRVAKVQFSDSYGHSKVVDATETQSFSLTDGDGKGVVTISTYGQTQGKSDCPDSSNVAVIYDKNGVNYYFVDKADLQDRLRGIDYLPSLSGLANSLLGSNPIRSATSFTSSFDGALGVSPDRTGVLGTKRTGEAFWTLNADADYFDAVPVYSPGLVGEPSVSINAVDTEKGGSSSVKVTIKNKEDFDADALLELSVSQGSLNTDSKTVKISSVSKSYTFVWEVGSKVTDSAVVTVKACSTSQFSDSNCDTDSDTISVTESKQKEYCGDGVCQANEDSKTCQEDCPFVVPPSEPNETMCEDRLGGLVTGIVEETRSCGFLSVNCWFGGEGKTTEKCVYDYTLVYVIIGVVFFLLFLALFFGQKGRKGKRGRKYVLWIFGSLLGLAVLYFVADFIFSKWYLVVLLIVVGLLFLIGLSVGVYKKVVGG